MMSALEEQGHAIFIVGRDVMWLGVFLVPLLFASFAIDATDSDREGLKHAHFWTYAAVVIVAYMCGATR